MDSSNVTVKTSFSFKLLKTNVTVKSFACVFSMDMHIATPSRSVEKILILFEISRLPILKKRLKIKFLKFKHLQDPDQRESKIKQDIGVWYFCSWIRSYLPEIFSTPFTGKSFSFGVYGLYVPLNIGWSWKWLSTQVALVLSVLMVGFVVENKTRLTFVGFMTSETLIGMIFHDWWRFDFGLFLANQNMLFQTFWGWQSFLTHGTY